jgi:hypothetical protein
VAQGTHVIAVICLGIAFLLVEAHQVGSPGMILWPALFALVPMAIVLFRLRRTPTVFWGIAYLIVGGLSIWSFAAIVIAASPHGTVATDVYLLMLPKAALIAATGPSRSTAGAFAWSASGFIVGEVAVRLAAMLFGGVVTPDYTAVGALVGIVGVRAIVCHTAPGSAGARASLQHAARSEVLALARTATESRASALFHDTVLDHLGALASAPAGPVDPDLQRALAHDLDMLAGEDWLAETVIAVDPALAQNWDTTALAGAIRHIRARGLDVDVLGDSSVIARLSNESAAALALAVQHCLVNVVKHSGTDHAEVVLAGSDSEVSVMVIDGGKGFSVDATAADRLGLRQSVRKRIEAVNGTVRVWSTPGSGTSIMIRLPALKARA